MLILGKACFKTSNIFRTYWLNPFSSIETIWGFYFQSVSETQGRKSVTFFYDFHVFKTKNGDFLYLKFHNRKSRINEAKTPWKGLNSQNFLLKFVRFFLTLSHRDIPLEATSSQKVRATKVSSGDQGGGLLSVIDPSVTEFEMKLKFVK